MSEPIPMQFVATQPPEEVARANFYGLLARLFYAPPDAELLDALASAGPLEAEGEGSVAEAWLRLAEAAGSADPETLREEYETVFVGTGKAPVTLYTSAYTIRFSNEVPLARLRGELAALGLSRRSEVHEPEDHVAALFDVMRYLIGEQKRELAEQKAFFERWIWPTIDPLCSAIQQSDKTAFYKAVSRFMRELCTVEHMAFEML